MSLRKFQSVGGWKRWLLLLATLGGLNASTAQTEQPARADVSADPQTVPIVDAHFHFMKFMSPGDLKEHMNRHAVERVVSAGAIGSPEIGNPNYRDGLVFATLGDRFLPAVGNHEFALAERQHGVAFFTAAEHPAHEAVLNDIARLLNLPPRTLGETFPNAERSMADPLRRRRVQTDGPVFRGLAQLAVKHDRPMSLHMEWHPESVAGLSRLLAAEPQLKVVLAHCGKTTKALDIDAFFQKHDNVVCDLSFRSLPQEAGDYKRFPERTIFWAASANRSNWLNPEWKQVIEKYPNRFMVGIDDVHDWGEYDEVVRAIREGLLSNLKPDVVAQVAHQNARRMFRLPAEKQ